MATIEDQPERTLESRLRFSRDMMAGPIYRKYEILTRYRISVEAQFQRILILKPINRDSGLA